MKMSEEMKEALKRYLETFGDNFPTIPLLIDLNEEECMKIIDECIKKKKDVYELGYLEDDLDIFY